MPTAKNAIVTIIQKMSCITLSQADTNHCHNRIFAFTQNPGAGGETPTSFKTTRRKTGLKSS
jgi:hypothetical protein